MSRKFLVPVVLPADPAAPLEAATKQYVDAQVLGNAGNEVFVGPSDPGTGVGYELWYDSDAPPSVAPGVGMTPGGLTNQVLAKISNTDFATNWITPLWLPLTGGTLSGAVQINSTLGVTGTMTTASHVLTSTNSIGWASYVSAAIWMQDATWVRFTPGIYMASGILATDGSLAVKTGGAVTSGYAADINGSLYVRNNVINGYTMGTGSAANRIVLTDANGYISGNYINMTADVVSGWPPYFAGQNGDNYMRWYNRAGALSLTQLTAVQNMGAGGWGAAALQASPGAGNAALALHCGGVAPMIYTANGFGNNLYHRDSVGNTGSANCVALQFLGDSTRRFKTNITDWPLRSGGAASLSAADLVDRLRPITFDTKWEDVEIPATERRRKALDRLNTWRHGKGLADYELPAHDCAVDPCNGTADDPCSRWLNSHHPMLGLIAEEVVEVLPTAVSLDIDRIPEAISLNQLLVLALASIKELNERIRVLEGEPA